MSSPQQDFLANLRNTVVLFGVDTALADLITNQSAITADDVTKLCHFNTKTIDNLKRKLDSLTAVLMSSQYTEYKS